MASKLDQHNPKLRKSGGQIVPFSREILYDTIEVSSQGWKCKCKTSVFPAFPDQQLEEDEKRAPTVVKEQFNVNKVLKMFYDFSESKKLGIKLFADIHVTKSKIKVLQEVFDVESPLLFTTSECPIEIDILSVNNSTICLAEVVSQQENASNSIEKLQRVEHFIRNLIKFTFPKNSECHIYKVLTSFVPLSTEVSVQATENDIMILKTNPTINGEVLSKILNGDSQRKEIFFDDFVVAMTVICCCQTLSYFRSEEDKVRQSLLDAINCLDLSNKEESKTSFDVGRSQPDVDLFVWLDPVQAKILRDKNPFQLIIGSVATGKTMLLQMKILDVLRTESHSKVLVVLPTSNLKSYYEKMFLDRSDETTSKRVTIVTASDNFWEIVRTTNPHIFIDEYCACADISHRFCVQFKMLFPGVLERDDRLMWISIDYRQVLQGSFETLNSKKYLVLEEPKFVKSYLMNQHRCCRGVFESYRFSCGPS
jgi:hypothetical protein